MERETRDAQKHFKKSIRKLWSDHAGSEFKPTSPGSLDSTIAKLVDQLKLFRGLNVTRLVADELLNLQRDKEGKVIPIQIQAYKSEDDPSGENWFVDVGQQDKTNKHKLLSIHMLGVGRRLRIFPRREAEGGKDGEKKEEKSKIMRYEAELAEGQFKDTWHDKNLNGFGRVI